MVNEMLVALQLCSGSTLRVIDNGLGITLNGLEEEIVGFALLEPVKKLTCHLIKAVSAMKKLA